MGNTDTLLIQLFNPPSSTYASILITPILWSPNFAELQEQNKVRYLEIPKKASFLPHDLVFLHTAYNFRVYL